MRQLLISFPSPLALSPGPHGQTGGVGKSRVMAARKDRNGSMNIFRIANSIIADHGNDEHPVCQDSLQCGTLVQARH